MILKKNIHLILKTAWKQISLLDCIGISMNLVILSADSRYDSCHRYQNTNVHLEIGQEAECVKHTGREDFTLLPPKIEFTLSARCTGDQKEQTVNCQRWQISPQLQTELGPQMPKWLHSSGTANSWDRVKRKKNTQCLAIIMFCCNANVEWHMLLLLA